MTIPATPAQRALARFRKEEDAFRTVLDVLAERRENALALGVFGVYRKRIRLLRMLYGRLLDGAEEHATADELQRFTPARRATPKARRLPRERDS